MKTQRVAICCGTPMVWTFAFRSAEWFCVVCKESLGMMNADHVEATGELLAERDRNDEWFRVTSEGFVPSGAMLRDCDKCGPNSYHSDHWTDAERQASRAALKRIMSKFPEPVTVEGEVVDAGEIKRLRLLVGATACAILPLSRFLKEYEPDKRHQEQGKESE